jgi:hypothetical protein
MSGHAPGYRHAPVWIDAGRINAPRRNCRPEAMEESFCTPVEAVGKSRGSAINIVAADKAHPSSSQNKKRTARHPRRSKTHILRYEDFTAFSSPTDGNRTGNRPRARTYRIAVVAGLNDPLSVLLPNDLTDMVRPHHDGSNAGCSGTAPMRPVARQIVRGSRITADELPHLPATPRGWTAA